MAKVTLPPITVRGVPLFDCAYAPHEEKYYIREGDRWTPYSEKNMKLRLRLEGLSTRTQQGANVSPVDAALHDVQTLRQVEHAAPLAGWESGLVEIAGKLILITESAKVLAAKDVPCPNLLKYLEELLGAEPLRHQLGWWRWARRNVGNKQMLPGQCCVYVGAAGVGKSLCQRLTSRLLCSRDASAYDYMSGRSTFNLELFAAEHLVIEDRFFDRGISTRREFGATIKEICVNHVQKCHGKHKQGITLWPKWRLTISLNDERENLNVLPPLDSSLMDKIMLFSCGQPNFPVDFSTEGGWEKWEQIISAELPGLAHHIDNYDLGDLALPRYGVKPWHDKEILAREESESNEAILLEILRHDIPPITEGKKEWIGTSADLERELTGFEMPSKDQTKKILGHYSIQNIGTLMGKLSTSHPAISKKKIKGTNKWHINLGKL